MTGPAPLPADPAALVGAKLGNYRLTRLVGQGKMGAVYLAHDEALLRPTAVKVLSWSDAEAGGHDPVEWFLAEARLVARINHPRVVQIYGAARHGSRFYIAMEYVAGTSAEAAAAERADGRLAADDATRLVHQAATALDAAHRCGVVHRDVKPANLLLGPGGVVKLGDFGMALGSAGVRTGHARLRVGTPFYTAPEIWRGEAASPLSDVYSLGATWFRLLTGRPPFVGADVAAVERGHLAAEVPDPRALVPSLPPACAAAVMRALAKSPRERQPSAEALAADARRILDEIAPRARRAAPASPPPLPPASARPERGAGGARSKDEPRPITAAPGGAMPLLADVSSLPDVRGAVRGTAAGGLVEAAGEADGESVAAVAGFVWSALAAVGDGLGLGPLDRFTVTGPSGGSVSAADARGDLVSALVAASGSTAAVERVLASAGSQGGA